jgi:hypothetical protein
MAILMSADAAAPRPATPAARPQPAWIQRSNADAELLLEVTARFQPEVAGFFGVSGVDDRILDLGPDLPERIIEATRQARAALDRRLTDETDPAVRQDLEIMLERADEEIEGAQLQDRFLIPYFNLPQATFQGLRALLDDQVSPARREKALVRLARYSGRESGFTPLTRLAEDRTREKLAKPGLLGPFRGELEKDLRNRATLFAGIEKLFQKYGIKGYEESYAELGRQLEAYEAFLRSELLPRAREDFRLPAELYAHQLRTIGIDLPVEELSSRARVAFREIQNEMRTLAPLVARERGWSHTDYRDVLRDLKKNQIVGEEILPHYEARIARIEELIRENRVISLPDRKMQIVLASEAESATIPAPNMRPPRMIGNTGEIGTFVLPLRIPGSADEPALQFDDFTYDAASWTLTAHEGRPGHELQFAAMVERGVSIARALFAFNSVNVEGWALYAEAEMKPYEPLEGQLVALQNRLMRAARAILDPGLQAGDITRDEAMRVLREDVGLSEAMATQEVERYTFWAPGQAPSYFCGYQRLMELRAEVERILGKRFDRLRYHDFLLAQGLLPPRLLRKAVLEEFVPSQASAPAQ